MFADAVWSESAIPLKPHSSRSTRVRSMRLRHACVPFTLLWAHITAPTSACRTAASNCGKYTSCSVRWSTFGVDRLAVAHEGALAADPLTGRSRRRRVGLWTSEALLVVGGEVLDDRDRTLSLGALDPGNGHLGIEERVLAVALEGSPAHRRPHDVHRRGIDEVVALLGRLVAGHGTGLAGEARLPGRR